MKKQISICSNPKECPYGDEAPRAKSRSSSKAPSLMERKQRNVPNNQQQEDGIYPAPSPKPARSTSVYYPANSPLNHLPRKVSAKKKAQETFMATMRTGFFVALVLLLAVILYAVLLDNVATIKDDVKDLKTMLQDLLQNCSMNQK